MRAWHPPLSLGDLRTRCFGGGGLAGPGSQAGCADRVLQGTPLLRPQGSANKTKRSGQPFQVCLHPLHMWPQVRMLPRPQNME